MQHDPNGLVFIEAQLIAVVASTERSEMTDRVCSRNLGMLVGDAREPDAQILPSALRGNRNGIAPATGVIDPAIIGSPMWDRSFCRQSQCAQIVRQIRCHQCRAYRCNAATNVNPNARRHDRTTCCDHSSDGRALSDMNVRHDRYVLVDEWQHRHIAELLKGGVLDGHSIRPHLDWETALILDDLHSSSPQYMNGS